MTDDELELLQQQDDDPFRGGILPPVVPETPGGSPSSDKELLQKYYASRLQDAQGLLRTEDAAGSNRFLARLGAAGNTAIQAAAGNMKPDNSAFEGMVKDADLPIESKLRQQKLFADQDKGITGYMAQKYKLGQAKDLQQERLAQQDRIEKENRTQRAFDASENRKMHQSVLDSTSKKEAEKKATLSDKQADEIGDFDKSIASAKDALAGAKPEYVGPIDGRLPDMTVGGDEAAFRAKVGRITDQYRRLVTGAGASNQELARLESRLPKVTDNLDQFKAKAEGFIQEVQKNRALYLENQRKHGKDVSAFEGSEDQKKSAPPKGGAAPAAKYAPGSVVKVRGKVYRVGSDGDSLEEVN